MSKSVIRPTLGFEWPQPLQPMIDRMSRGLRNLEHARSSDLLGFALGHGVGKRYIGGAVSEYLCAFVGNGDAHSCDGTVNALADDACNVIKAIRQQLLEDDSSARLFNWAFGNPRREFETIHFAVFTVVIIFDDNSAERGISEIRIVANPARDAGDAVWRIAEIQALFTFLAECHDTLSRFSYELRTPDMLRRAA